MSTTIDLQNCTSLEAIEVWEREREAREMDEARRLEKVFAIESPQLQSLTEGANLCPGWNVDEGCVNGGDEPDEGEDICRGCVREEERFYQREMMEAEGIEEFVAYPHLMDRE